VRAALADLRPGDHDLGDTREHTIEVRYDGEDLEAVSRLTGLSAQQVVAAHTGTPWQVAFCGFAPGFSYLVGGDPRLEVPRRDESRVRVPAGAVALAGPFSSVYPRASPGGWQLIGHTDAVLWDTHADPPALLTPGSTVRFVEARA
jgi:KipI family sensor histidine kinase inhibitor